MTGASLTVIQLGVFAAALLVAAFATVLQRRPEPDFEWPASPPPQRDMRRDRTLIIASVLYLLAGSTLGALTIMSVVLQMVAGDRGPAGG